MTEEIFIKEFVLAYQEVTYETPPESFGSDFSIADLNLDSLTMIELISCLEEKLDTSIKFEQFRSLSTPRDVFAALTGVGVSGSIG